MDNLNLNSDETIIKKTQIVIITGVRHEAVLTSRRLILIENETGRIHEDISFSEIDQAIPGVNKLREPIITLVVNSPGGEKRTIELIFIHFIGDKNIVELEKCLSILKEHNVLIGGISLATIRALLTKVDRKNKGTLLDEEQVSRPAVPEWIVFGSLNTKKQSLEEEPPELKPLHTLAIIFLIFVVMIAGISIVGQTMQEKTQTDPYNMTASTVKSGVTISPSPVPTPTPARQVTPVPTESPPRIIIPPVGVWVRVQYPGNFSGYMGARGRNIDVSGSGIQWYQLPVVDPTLDGIIAKLDGSSDKMVVETYKDGTLISRKSTKSPYGSIDLHGAGSEDLTNDVETNVVPITPVPIPENLAIEDYLPKITIPTTGVWVRVYYPGSFSGSIGGRGISTPIKSTGDQLYEIPANVGMVEGTIEKDDKSGGKLVTEVYKDGALISRMETMKPLGLIDVHVPV
ncbi:MAG: hypothetical protein Q7U51_11980 [Methanoregula sp.]|nr:hypothetical protein [Methanoregula sp.]